MREGLDPGLAQALELGAAISDRAGLVVRRLRARLLVVGAPSGGEPNGRASP